MLLTRSLVRGLVRPLVKTDGAVEFTPLSLSPYLYLDASREVMKTGAVSAGDRELVAGWGNLGVGASDATQGVSLSQPRYHKPTSASVGHLYLPGVAGNNAGLGTAMNLGSGDPYSILWEGVIETQASVALLSSSVGTSGRIYLSSNGNTFAIGNGFSIALSRTVCTGEKVSILLEFDGGSGDTRVYESGELIGTSSSSISPVTQALDLIGQKWGGATSILNYRGTIERVRVIHNSVTLYDINFSTEAHRATSFDADVGGTITINSTGSDPSTIVRKPFIRFDGTDDALYGTFSPSLTGGRMFAVYAVNGTPTNSDRVFSVGSGGSDTNASSYIPSLFISSGLSAYASAGTLTHTGGFTGRFLHESNFGAGSQSSKRNNTDLQTGSLAMGSLSLASYGVANQYQGGGAAYPSVDVEHLSLFPVSLTTEEVGSVVTYQNENLVIF